MSNENKQCAGITKSGSPCKNRAQQNSAYCHIHQQVVAEERKAEIAALTTELNGLAEELKKVEEKFSVPPFSTPHFIQLLRQNIDKFSPEMRLSIINELKDSFEGAEAKDFLDPDTWKGMWYILNYSAQNNTDSLRQILSERLSVLPGVEFAQDLRNSLEGASPKDFLEVDTWKGIWYMVNYSVRFEADRMKQRILGEHE